MLQEPAGPNPKKMTAYASPLGATAIYVITGTLWAAFSDVLLLHKFPEAVLFINRLGFILVSGGLFYFLARHHAQTLSDCVAAEQESAATARAFLNAVSEGILVIDQQGRIMEVSPGAEHLFGYSKAELAGRAIEVLLPERFREHHVRHRNDFFINPRTGVVDANLAGQRKDGTEFPARISLSYVPTKDGGHAIALVTDITEQLNTEREARRAETMATLGAIAAGIAHELNNPLAIISSRIELMLATSPDLPPKTHDDLKVLLGTVGRASNIVHDLLALARERPKAWERVDLNALVSRVLLLLGDQIRKDRIQVSVRLDESLPPVSGDRTALEQVLINLMMNARDAMPGGGTIEIETEAMQARPGWVRLMVRDRGCGIAPEEVPKLFNRFYTTKPKGTGLGLWLSQRIIVQHRGHIAVQSELGKGATFEITLPATIEKTPGF